MSTRWYRAPELLFASRHYNLAVDVWSAGAVIAELFSLFPLFPGTNDIDQIYRIFQVMGSPSEETWEVSDVVTPHQIKSCHVMTWHGMTWHDKILYDPALCFFLGLINKKFQCNDLHPTLMRWYVFPSLLPRVLMICQIIAKLAFPCCSLLTSRFWYHMQGLQILNSFFLCSV